MVAFKAIAFNTWLLLIPTVSGGKRFNYNAIKIITVIFYSPLWEVNYTLMPNNACIVT
jgi:hypothetical protein